MEYMTPNFTKEMVKTHKILIPNMAVTQFRLMQAALASEGYQTEVLGNCGSEVAQLGLKYVHNDTCYPALLVIGQFLDALNSGKYDLDHTALLITQTGGGCRASNYIKLLRKALVKAGYGNIPVASLNFSGLEKGSGLPLTLPLLRKVIAAIFYGDMLVALRSQTAPYENHKGDADAMTEKWIARIQEWIRTDRNYSAPAMKKQFPAIAADYATIPVTRVPKVKVGVVGEIYVKYSPLGNNDLEKFLESQDCEVNLPGLMGFVEYCVANTRLDIDLYGGNKLVAGGADAFLGWLDSIGVASYDAMRQYGFYAPGSFRELMKKPEGIISLGAKMGEGWLLTAEMLELVEGGYGNIVCAQPFGCLPNHIVGKGMINKIRALHPEANITPVDYDPGKPHQANAGRGPGEAGPSGGRTGPHDRRGTGRRRPPAADHRAVTCIQQTAPHIAGCAGRFWFISGGAGRRFPGSPRSPKTGPGCNRGRGEYCPGHGPRTSGHARHRTGLFSPGPSHRNRGTCSRGGRVRRRASRGCANRHPAPAGRSPHRCRPRSGFRPGRVQRQTPRCAPAGRPPSRRRNPARWPAGTYTRCRPACGTCGCGPHSRPAP